jgi:serine/threonine-protein kinase HipA
MIGPRDIEVVADWDGLGGPTTMGTLRAARTRGREVFSFAYDEAWLRHRSALVFDPALQLYPGPQYPAGGHEQFGAFLDSAPDRWGRMLLRRREALLARREGRAERTLGELDYLLGVHDPQRLGGLRFRSGHRYLDDSGELAAPPWTALRELHQASRIVERDDEERDPDYARWLGMLVAPGSSLGGARPKAGVRDPSGQLWLAKFPSRDDRDDVGGWEQVLSELARAAGLTVPASQVAVLGRRTRGSKPHRTFLSRRFDRTPDGTRRHYTSAMTMLGRTDGRQGHDGASYQDLAAVLVQRGAAPATDLEQLWRRIVFFVCVSNTDDHLRNHGFLLEGGGLRLSPAFDLNPNPDGEGLALNISATDNTQDLSLVESVAPMFRVGAKRARNILGEVLAAVRTWPQVATAHGFGAAEQSRMAHAFRLATG